MNKFSRLSTIFYLSILIFICSCSGPVSDQYPGDADFTKKVQELFKKVQNDNMDFPWHGKKGISRKELCKKLIERHFKGTNKGMTDTNASWLMCEDVDQKTLEEACDKALSKPKGYSSSKGWEAWQGTHKGTWYDDTKSYPDEAKWSKPTSKKTNIKNDNDKNGKPRVYDFQKVKWPGRKVGRFGWNQSHAEVPYVWGWDPKDNGNENGDIGTHIGFTFEIGSCKFIIWITPKAAFLEGINTSKKVTKTVNGKKVTGYPKTSTALTGGRGQWIVEK